MISNQTSNSLTAQQQKIFEMTNNHHAVGPIGGITSPSATSNGPSMAMAFNNKGVSGKGGSNTQMNTIIASNKQAAAHYSKHQHY